MSVPNLISPAASRDHETNLGLWKWKMKAQLSRAPLGRSEEKRKAKMQEEMKGFLLTKVDLDRVYRRGEWVLPPFLQGFEMGQPSPCFLSQDTKSGEKSSTVFSPVWNASKNEEYRVLKRI